MATQAINASDKSAAAATAAEGAVAEVFKAKSSQFVCDKTKNMPKICAYFAVVLLAIGTEVSDCFDYFNINFPTYVNDVKCYYGHCGA